MPAAMISISTKSSFRTFAPGLSNARYYRNFWGRKLIPHGGTWYTRGIQSEYAYEHYDHCDVQQHNHGEQNSSVRSRSSVMADIDAP